MEELQHCQQCGSASWDWLCDPHLAAHQEDLEKAYFEAFAAKKVSEIQAQILDEQLLRAERALQRAGWF